MPKGGEKEEVGFLLFSFFLINDKASREFS